jgi:hypothetical protein
VPGAPDVGGPAIGKTDEGGKRANAFPDCMVIGVWSLARQSTERISESLSMMRACRGRCSQTLIPGTRVAMDWNGPRTSLGASGLGSHESRWLRPPESQNRITELLLGRELELAGVAPMQSKLNEDNPAIPAKPVCKNQRLDPTRTPPQEIEEEFMVLPSFDRVVGSEGRSSSGGLEA